MPPPEAVRLLPPRRRVARRIGLVLGVATALCTAQPIRAQDSGIQELPEAHALYAEGRFEESCALYRRLLAETPDMAVEDRVTAAEHLGIGLMLLGRPDEGRQAFIRLLETDPTHRLDELYVLPEVVNAYEAIRAEYLETHPIRLVRPTQSIIYSLLPFGAGQYFNDQSAKAIALGAAETAAVGISIFGYYYKERYCREVVDGRCRSDEGDAHARWERIQKAGGILAAGLLMYGFVDGILFYQKEQPLAVLPWWDAPGGSGGLNIAWRF